MSRKVAILFPGQGAQEVGMGRDLFAKDPLAGELIALASDLLQTDLKKICLRGPQRELAKTANLQPALTVLCLALWSRFQESGIPVTAVAGHSVGELSALAASGMATCHDMVSLAVTRGRLMAKAADERQGGMAAITGVPSAMVLETLDFFQHKGTLSVAAINAPEQTVVSGDGDTIDGFIASLDLKKGYKVNRLRVSGAWHSKHMTPALKPFKEALEQVSLNPRVFSMIFNRDGQDASEPDAVRKCIANQLVRPVRWDAVMRHFCTLNITDYIEIGPGRVLSGLVRLNTSDPEIKVHNISDLKSFQRTVARLDD